VVEERQPHFRGGVYEPLSRVDIEEQFTLNFRDGGGDEKRAAAAIVQLAKLFYGKFDLVFLRG
ncbi:MAG: hypothetical protein WBX78_25520, partial [Pseudolabrys sp.]